MGTLRGSTIVTSLMMRNPDPKPGRWILPLIVIGMVAFAYVFVSNLDTAPEVTAASTTTTTIDPLGVDPVASTTVPVIDATTQAYLDQVTLLNTDLDGLAARLQQLNADWDARTIDYATARNTLRDEIIPELEAWAVRVADAAAPPSYATDQAALTDAAAPVVAASQAVLAGLESSDTGEARAAALVDFTTAVTGFQTAATTITSSAG